MAANCGRLRRIAGADDAGGADGHGHAVAPHLVAERARGRRMQPGRQVAGGDDVAEAAGAIRATGSQQLVAPLGLHLGQGHVVAVGQQNVGVEEGEVRVVRADGCGR